MGKAGRHAVRAIMLAAGLLLLSPPGAHAFIHRPPPGWRPPGADSPFTDRPQYVVVLILDGALPSYFNLARFPHIAGLLREGISYTDAWDGMLETETPTGHASLGTGSVPRRHGVISFGWVTDANVPEQPTNPIPIQQGQLEQVLKRSGVPSLASLLKQRDRSARVVVTGGHKDYAVDSVGGWAADYIMYYAVRNQMWTPIAIPRHVPPQSVMQAPGLTMYAPHLASGDQDSLAIKLALSAFRTIHQKLTIVNLPEFDWPLGHLRGGRADPRTASLLMSRLDGDIGAIEDELKQDHVLKKTLFVLTADHGMVTLNHLIPHDVIQKAVEAAGTSTIDYEFHTGGYLYLRDHTRAPQVAANLMALHNPYIRAVYYRKPGTYAYELAAGAHLVPGVNRAYQFLLGTMAGPSSPQVAIFLRENSSIQGRNQIGWHGDHGGASWTAEHIPLIFAGPGVLQGVKSSYPATIYDIAPTILTLLKIQPQGMDGVTLADGLIDPDPALLAAQEQRGAQLAPFVQALQRQSRQDGP